MGQICQHCHTLLNTQVRSAHHRSISRLNNSELIKCSLCSTLVLSEQNVSELLRPGASTSPALSSAH